MRICSNCKEVMPVVIGGQTCNSCGHKILPLIPKNKLQKDFDIHMAEKEETDIIYADVKQECDKYKKALEDIIKSYDFEIVNNWKVFDCCTCDFQENNNQRKGIINNHYNIAKKALGEK